MSYYRRQRGFTRSDLGWTAFRIWYIRLFITGLIQLTVGLWGVCLWILRHGIPLAISGVTRVIAWIREALVKLQLRRARRRQDAEVCASIERLICYQRKVPVLQAYYLHYALITSGLHDMEPCLVSPEYSAALFAELEEWTWAEGQAKVPWLTAIADALATQKDIDGVVAMEDLFANLERA